MENSLNQHIVKLLPKFKALKKAEINHLIHKVATMKEKELREVLHKMAGSFACYNFIEIGQTLRNFENDQKLDSKRQLVKQSLEDILRQL